MGFRLLSITMETLKESDTLFLGLVGDKVREQRKSLGMNQERLAELALIHPTYVSHIEGDKVNASVMVYRRIAAALQVPLVTLLDVNVKVEAPDELMRAMMDIKNLGTKEQRMILQGIKGLIAGVRGH
jgi:transcriptional regulator with XRE-family HTH domain